MIRKTKAGYEVVSQKGKRLGGPYKLISQAVRRVAQVERHKKEAKR